MVEFTPLSKAEIDSIVTRNAQAVIRKVETIDEDTEIEMRNSAYFDGEAL